MGNISRSERMKEQIIDDGEKQFDIMLYLKKEKDRAFRQGLSTGVSIAALIVSVIVLIVQILR